MKNKLNSKFKKFLETFKNSRDPAKHLKKFSNIQVSCYNYGDYL